MNQQNKDKQIASIATTPSDALAAQVVLYRAVGLNKDIAMLCMAELVKRRNIGDEFDYESFISSHLETMPKPKNMDYLKLIKGMKNNMENKK